MVTQPTLLRITAHATPHSTDPPGAHEFYTLIGMLTVAWGRLEGHIIGALLMILALPEAAAIAEPLPLSWGRRERLWRKAFNTIPRLQIHRDRAVAFMDKVVGETTDRNFVVHAIWDEFQRAAPELTLRARSVNPRKGTENTIDVLDVDVSVSLLRLGLNAANALNLELVEFTTFLSSLRPPPSGIRTL